MVYKGGAQEGHVEKMDQLAYVEVAQFGAQSKDPFWAIPFVRYDMNIRPKPEAPVQGQERVFWYHVFIAPQL